MKSLSILFLVVFVPTWADCQASYKWSIAPSSESYSLIVITHFSGTDGPTTLAHQGPFPEHNGAVIEDKVDDPNATPPPAKPQERWRWFGYNIRSIANPHELYPGDKGDTFKLSPGKYTVECWGDLPDIFPPPAFQFEIKAGEVTTIELTFTSTTLTSKDIAPELYKQY